MKTRVFGLSLVVVAIVVALMPVSVGAQAPGTETSVTVTDVVAGAPLVGKHFTTDLQVSVDDSRIRCTGARPEGMTDDHRLCRARFIFSPEIATQYRLHTQSGKEIPGRVGQLGGQGGSGLHDYGQLG